jgi:hypothetical protein
MAEISDTWKNLLTAFAIIRMVFTGILCHLDTVESVPFGSLRVAGTLPNPSVLT